MTQANATTSRRARDNPFAVDRVLEVRYRFETGSTDDLCSRLKKLNWRGAIVGPKGTGKTTLSEDLAKHLSLKGWHVRTARLTAERPRLDRSTRRQLVAELCSGDVIIMDGAEQLSQFAWWRFQQQSCAAGGLIVTAHHSGLLPTLHKTHASLGALEHVLDQLVPGATIRLRRESEQLLAEHQGNIREVLRALYDRWALGQLDAKAISS